MRNPFEKIPTPPSKAKENIISNLKEKTEGDTVKSEIFDFKSVLDFIAKSIKHDSVFILKKKMGLPFLILLFLL